MKIAIFSDTFMPAVNGVANVVYQSALALSGRGHDVRLYTVSRFHNGNLSAIFHNKVTPVTLPSLPFWGYKGERMALPSGRSMLDLKKFGADIIHVHTPFLVGWEAVISAKLRKTAIIGTHHTFYDYYLKHIKLDNPAMKKFSWKYIVSFYNNCDLVLAPTRALADELKANGLKPRYEILPNAIDTHAYRPAGEKDKTALKRGFGVTGRAFIYMGRLSYEKSIDRVITAFAQAAKADSAATLMLVGDGPEKDKLEQQCARLGIEGRVKFTGYLNGAKLLAALQAGDLFLTASESENMPISILEAMATGLPVIATATGGLPEIIEDGFNGRLISFADPGKAAREMLSLLNNTAALEAFSQAARRRALDYSLDRVTAQLEKIYKFALTNVYESMPLPGIS